MKSHARGSRDRLNTCRIRRERYMKTVPETRRCEGPPAKGCSHSLTTRKGK